MVFTKDYRIIETKQNSTIAHYFILNMAQDNSVFFPICIKLLEIKKVRDCRTRSILEMICPEASNVICYELHMQLLVCQAVVEVSTVNLRLYLTTSW